MRTHHSGGLLLLSTMLCAAGCSQPAAGPVTGQQVRADTIPTLTATPTMVATGGMLMVTVSGGPGDTTDWVGLFRVGDPDTNAQSWQYLNGTQTPPAMGLTMATLNFTAPNITGNFEFRFLPNDTTVHSATSNMVQVTSGASTTMATATPAMVMAGGTETVMVTGGPGNPTDWVGLFRVGDPNTNALSWQYFNGMQTPPAMGQTMATLSFTMPTVAGNYEFRVLSANSYNVIATSNMVQVTAAGAGAMLTATPSTITPGGMIMVALTGGPGNPGDWVALYRVGDPNTNALDWQYLNGTQTQPAMGQTMANLSFTAPARAGNYEFRLLTNNSYNSIATSNTVQVGNNLPMLMVSTNTAKPGDMVTVTVTNGPGNPTDWLALAAVGSDDRILLAWDYLNGQRTAPTTGLTTAMVSFTMPSTPGGYLFRFFANDGFQKLATSPTVTVSP